MQKSNFKKETDPLHQIAQASEAIRHKHRLIKLGRESVHKAMSEALKPVVAPLEKLVTQTEVEATIATKKKDKKRNRRRQLSPPPLTTLNDPFKTAFEKEDEDEYMALPSQRMESLYSLADYGSPVTKSTPMKRTTTPDTERSQVQRTLQQYLRYVNENPSKVDVKYGVRMLKKSGLHIGDTPVSFVGDVMHLGDQQYPLTFGLIELIFSKDPDMNVVKSADEESYGTILRNTNAARKNYKAGDSVRADLKLDKYVDIIRKLVGGEEEAEEVEEKEKEKVGSALPRHLIASRKRPRTDYVYWDNPNELVERLRLLIASQSAGNPSHTNEIIAIIEELREADIIY